MHVLKFIISYILSLEARLVLWRYRPNIIAVTGSVGKTTTKDAIFAALSNSVFVRKSDKSYNSEIGVPLTILGIENAWRSPMRWGFNMLRGLWLAAIYRPYPAWLVLEVGADRPGDIRRIARWLRPNVVVITGVPEVPVHVEFFGSVDALVREKRSLAEHIRSGGTIVLNGDDAQTRALIPDFRGACITYGFNDSNDYAASQYHITYEAEKPTGFHFRLDHGGSSFPIDVIGSLGAPKVYAALAAVAVAQAIGVDPVTASRALAQWSPTPGRMRLLEGVQGTVIIDDTYNYSPAAAFAALETLRDVGHAKRKIALLGDMLELGKFSAEAHRSVGGEAARCTSLLWTVGFRAQGIAEGALESGMLKSKIKLYKNGEAARAGEELARELKPGDIVLVKGSQSMRLEHAITALLEHPDTASSVLVRQESEWLKR